jgi:hypothetical protein
MSDNKNTLPNTVNAESKRDWAKPEILDLDIKEDTQNAAGGATSSDGGSFFFDYNS